MLTPALLFAMLLNAIVSTIRNTLDIILIWNKLGIQLPEINLKERVENLTTLFKKDKTAANGQATPAATAAKAE